MPNKCEDCGSNTYSGRCVNCHEELYIVDQYIEQGLPLPDPQSDFMQSVIKQEENVKNNLNV